MEEILQAWLSWPCSLNLSVSWACSPCLGKRGNSTTWFNRLLNPQPSDLQSDKLTWNQHSADMLMNSLFLAVWYRLKSNISEKCFKSYKQYAISQWQAFCYSILFLLKMYRFISIFFPPRFQRETIFLTSCLEEDEVVPRRDLLFKERISPREQFFPLWDNPNLCGRQQ